MTKSNIMLSLKSKYFLKDERRMNKIFGIFGKNDLEKKSSFAKKCTNSRSN